MAQDYGLAACAYLCAACLAAGGSKRGVHVYDSSHSRDASASCTPWESPSREFLNDRLYRFDHWRVLGGVWPVAVDRTTEVQDLACCPEAQPVHLPGEVDELALRCRP